MEERTVRGAWDEMASQGVKGVPSATQANYYYYYYYHYYYYYYYYYYDY